MIKLLVCAGIVLILNIPFGYWRANVKRFSLQWFLAIHIPVPMVFALRLVSDIGFHWTTYVVLISAFFLGQQTGSMIIRRLKWLCREVTSCMVMDLVRCARHPQSSAP